MTAGRPGTRPAPVDSFGLALPAEWLRLPLEPGEFELFVARQRRRLAGSGELSRTGQRRFELLLRQLRHDCLRERVTLAAVLATPVDGPSSTGAADVLAATCTLATLTQAGLATELPLTVNTLAAALARGRSQPAGGGGQTDLEPPTVTALPAGTAVKLLRLHTLPPGATTQPPPRLLAAHFLVPFDAGRRAAVLSLATPNVELADPMRALFDEIAATLCLLSDGRAGDR